MMTKMTEQPEKKRKEEDEFFEEEKDERTTEQHEHQEPEWLRRRKEWLRGLSQEDRDYIAIYGIDLWEIKTGRKRYA